MFKCAHGVFNYKISPVFCSHTEQIFLWWHNAYTVILYIHPPRKYALFCSLHNSSGYICFRSTGRATWDVRGNNKTLCKSFKARTPFYVFHSSRDLSLLIAKWRQKPPCTVYKYANYLVNHFFLPTNLTFSMGVDLPSTYMATNTSYYVLVCVSLSSLGFFFQCVIIGKLNLKCLVKCAPGPLCWFTPTQFAFWSQWREVYCSRSLLTFTVMFYIQVLIT